MINFNRKVVSLDDGVVAAAGCCSGMTESAPIASWLAYKAIECLILASLLSELESESESDEFLVLLGGD